MSIPFKSTAHFFLYEKRPANRLRGKITSHPFACVAVGYDPIFPGIPFRVSAAVCHPKDNMVRAVGANKALGLLHRAEEGRTAHVAWLMPSEVKNVRDVLFKLGFTDALGVRFNSASNKPEWTRANKSFKYVLADVQGIRVNADVPTRKVAKARSAKA
jgi:hypothetical protein